MTKKNQKYRNQKKRRSFPWLLVALGGALVVFAAMLFANRSGGDGMPAISVDQRKIDYGNVKFGVNKSFAIKVTNTGDGTLRFKQDPFIEVVEGC